MCLNILCVNVSPRCQGGVRQQSIRLTQESKKMEHRCPNNLVFTEGLEREGVGPQRSREVRPGPWKDPSLESRGSRRRRVTWDGRRSSEYFRD